MVKLNELEKAINGKLRGINPDYAIANLKRNVDGKYDFDLKVSIDPRHFSGIREVLREVLGTLPADRQVQAKYYLSGSLASEIKKRAETEGVTQSQFVSRCVVEHIGRKGKARAR